MGRDIDKTEFSREDRTRYRNKVKSNLAALEQLVREGRFETGRRNKSGHSHTPLVSPAGPKSPVCRHVFRFGDT